MYRLGVDIGGTTCKIGAFKEPETLLESWEIPTRRENNGVEVLPDISRSIEEFLRNNGIEKSQVRGIGVGVPGTVTDTGKVGFVTNIGWKNLDVAEELHRLTELPVQVQNDANMAALGELCFGGAKGKRSMVMFTLGTGVGGAVISGGRVICGTNGAAGEWGHLRVNPKETAVCGCGKRGCLEQYASATGMVRLMKNLLEKSKEDSLLRGAEITAKAIWEAVDKKDALAEQVADEATRYLGQVIAAAVLTADPEIVLLGGGVSKAGDALLSRVREAYRSQTFHACLETPIELAKLGNSAGIYGCMGMEF